MTNREISWRQSALNLIMWLLSRLGVLFGGERSRPSNNGLPAIIFNLMMVSLITFLLIMFVRLFGGG